MPRLLTAAAAATALALAGCSGSDGTDTAAPTAATPAASSASASPSASPTSSESASAGGSGPLYLALGDSLAAGYQPGGAELRDSAYPALAAARLGREGADLTVENISCSGESTASFLEGGTCDYAGGSQMAEAESVLEKNRGNVGLVTIDIGGNDLRRCIDRSLTVDESCVAEGLDSVRTNLPTILERLRDAAGEDVPILVLGYYNPFLAASYLGEGQSQLPAATRGYTALDRSIRAAATEAGAVPVPLNAAFKLDDETPTEFGGREVPTNVAQVCTLTYICTAFDIHLTDEGAAVVGRVVAQAATKAGVR